MNYLAGGIIVMVCAVAQLALGTSGLFPIVPAVVLVYLCLHASQRSVTENLWLALLGGLLLDYFSGLPDGVMLISVPVSVQLGRYLANTLLSQKYSNLLIPAYVLFGTLNLLLLSSLVQWLMYLLGWVDSVNYTRQLTMLPVAVFWNLITLPLVYAFNLLHTNLEHRFWPKQQIL